jgi:N-acetylglucosamine malate deacetylase 2
MSGSYTNGKRKILVILAHPDDECFPIGGTLAKYAAEGVEIKLVCATRGEAGIPEMQPGPAGHVREAELRQAARVLGVQEVQFLDYLDGALDQADPEEIVEQLVQDIRQVRPQAVITFGPDGISGHPDHLAVHFAATAAFERAKVEARLYYIAPSEATLQGCGVVPSVEVAGGPVAAIDVGEHLVTKVRAMQSHSSQNPPFPGLPEEEAERMACHEYFTLASPHDQDEAAINLI